jgi:quinol monooxygenase YgiN/predicted nucleic acid-binding Zn ribbon protein
MSFCIRIPQPAECCIYLWNKSLCFECAETLPSDPKIAKDVEFGIYFGAVILFMVGVWNVMSFIRVYLTHNNYISVIRLANILYAFGTGIFAVCRIYFQFGKPLLVLAAIHNLCEWVFVCHAFYKNKKQRETMILLSIAFIFMVIGMIIIIFPEISSGALVEQVTGISLDFSLPIIWYILYRQNKQKSANGAGAQTYFVALVAHSIHLLFTILPLVFEPLVRDLNETLSRSIEFVILLSVPATHILYTVFVDLFEENIDLPSIMRTKVTDDNTNGTDYDDISVVQKPSSICGMTFESPVNKMLFWYILCIGIGLFPTALIPASLPKCDTEAETDNTKFEDFIIGTTKAKIYPGMESAFEYYVTSHNLIENARNFEGNVFFYFNKDYNHPSTYHFVEGWKSKEAAQNWIASDYDKAVFNEYTFAMFETQPEINGYFPFRQDYNPITSDNIGKAATRHVYTGWNGCEDIGEDSFKLGDCQWMYGCDHIEIINEAKKEQIMVMDDGTRYHCMFPQATKTVNGDRVEYKVVHRCDTGVIEHYSFVSDGSDECQATVSMDIDLSVWKTVDAVVELFSNKPRAFIQDKYRVNESESEEDAYIYTTNETRICNVGIPH